MRMISLLFRIATLGTYYGFIVRRSIRQVREGLKGTSPPIVKTLYYGATYIDPKQLAVWFLVDTNADLAVTEDSGLEDRLRAETRAALMRNGYPRSSASEVAVGVVSSENVEEGWGLAIFSLRCAHV
jgi:hypothetical protein